MRFREVYCTNCNKTLGRYNTEYYDEDKIGELLRTSHSSHVREGHEVDVRLVDG